MPTIRRTEASNLFVRDDWSQPQKARSLSIKLLDGFAWCCPTCRANRQPGQRMPNCSPDHKGHGFTEAEAAVLLRIAAGDDTALALVGYAPGGLNPSHAKWALETWGTGVGLRAKEANT